jgi:uncharacterized protein YkwD
MLRLLFAMMLAAALLFQPGGSRADDLDPIRALALALVNQSRKEHNLPPLALEAKLNKAAQGHASDMLKRNFYSHTSPEGTTIGGRYKQAGGSNWLLTAENIAQCPKCAPPATEVYLKQLQEGWMNSPGHRKNILHQGVTEFGFGIAVDARGGLYAVQNFAGPGTPIAAGGSGGGKPIGPRDQAALALLAINAERQKAGQAALKPSDALDKAAQAMLPRKGDETFSLEKKSVLELIAPDERSSWGTVNVVAALCGGCGLEPVAADVSYFTGQWTGQGKHRAMLLGAEATHLGFAIGANGAGKKVAVGVFGEKP